MMPETSALQQVNPRLVPVPDTAPPYDCLVHGARCPARAGPGVATAADAPLAGVAGPGVARPAGVAPAGAPALASSVASPAAADPATVWPRQLALVIVEVLAGARPDRQLAALATDRVRARVRGLAPLLASDRRPRVARIVTSRPAARIVEMTVVADFGQRSRALAMRFEHVAARPAAPGWPARPARWLCTAIEAG
jgi:Family of unknown function (DUF6459)